MDRRKFLKVAGGGVILAAGVGALGMRLTRMPEAASQPWRDAGSLYDEPRRKALSYAILAPNPHNRQPWLIDLAAADTVTVHVDRDRVLPHTDPLNRQITIGIGCFLELMRMAASQDGYRVAFDLFPDGQDASALDARPVAVARFTQDPSVTRDPLFRHVLARRSLKEPFDLERPVPTPAMDAMRAVVGNGNAVGASNDPAHVATLRALTSAAMLIEIETPRTYKESVDLFRIGKTEIEANPDGIDFSGPMFEAMHLTGMFTREAALDTTSTAYAEGITAVLRTTDTAMGHVWLVSPGNTRIDQINAGRDWLRINLAATAAGLGAHPLSQALQEYPEMAASYAEAHRMLAPGGGTVQMLGRLGYGIATPPSPRWPLETRMLGAKP